MQRKSVILSCAWAASILIAVGLARRSSAPEPAPPSEPRVVVRTVEVPVHSVEFVPEPLPEHLDEPLPEERVAVLSEAPPAEPERLSPVEYGFTLHAALQSTDIVARNLVIAHLLANLGPENVGEALAVFEGMPRSEVSDHSFRLFLHAWARFDGPAAMEYLAGQRSVDRVGGGEHSAMAGWARQDPAAARAYVESLEPKRAGELSGGLVRGWARTDLAAAREYVEQLEHPEHRRRLVGVLARGTLEDHGSRVALNWIDRVTRSPGASTDPSYGAAVFDEVLRNMKPADAPEVADWIDRNAEHPHLEDWVFQKVSRDYVRVEPGQARDWVEGYRLSGSERFNYGVIGNFAGAWARDDPYTAMEWAANMEMPSRQSSAYSQIANQWNENDLESAEAWLQEGRDDPLMDDARRRYSMRIAREDPVRALEYGAQIMREDYREESLVNAARILHGRNPEAVQAWLPVSGLGPEAQAEILAGN